jgi:CBS domain-containing protein
MPDKFDLSVAPFNRLTPQQQDKLKASLDVGYYRQHEFILTPNTPCKYLYIIIKGGVEEAAEDKSEIYAHYANDDIFDIRSQFENKSKHSYQALEDTLCYLLPTDIFQSFYQQNKPFSDYFDNNLARRQQLIKQAHQQQNLAEFMLTKVSNDNVLPAVIVQGDASLANVTAKMKEQAVDAVLVKLNQYDSRLKHTPSEQPFGIVTRTDLLHAVMLDSQHQSSPVGPITRYPVHHVYKGDFLFNAMILMTRHKIKRVLVCGENSDVGMIDMTQILSLFSTHSHVLTLRIARASSVEELAMAANSQTHLVETLINNGIKTRFMMQLIASVNEQIIEKAFQLVVPDSLQQLCCLFVLGSEGRGEQILKTDQDNALIINDELQPEMFTEAMNAFTNTLQQLGYPLCPGKVMVNNPQWVHTQSQWQQEISNLCTFNNPENMLKLAILTDAHAVAGNKELLAPLKQHIHAQLSDQELLLSHFTRPALQFNVPLTLFGSLKKNKEGLNIKQGGIFPIVHGIRALSLEYNIPETNTFARLDQLTQQKVLEHSTAENLSEALKLFIKLRLAQQISAQSEHSKTPSDNLINVNLLERTERDLLRHSLHVVKKFKEWLGYHYQIRD